jgi:cobalamin-dependent methionine synthase I
MIRAWVAGRPPGRAGQPPPQAASTPAPARPGPATYNKVTMTSNTRAYVEQDLAGLFVGEVRYARDAFEGLRLTDAFMAVKQPERIGVALSGEFQLAPERSTDALIAQHPQAKYFST